MAKEELIKFRATATMKRKVETIAKAHELRPSEYLRGHVAKLVEAYEAKHGIIPTDRKGAK